MNYTVYLIKDLRDGKVLYVGKTNNFKRRKRQHLSLRAHTKERIASIGTDNITITPIANFDSREEALKYEDELILKYNTIADGFNKFRSGLIYVFDKNEYQKHLYATNEEHRKKALEYHKQYYRTNKETILEQQKCYYDAHREQKREENKRYYDEHKKQRKLYLKEHKEEIREYMRQYYQNKKVEKQLKLDIANTPKEQFVQLTIPF